MEKPELILATVFNGDAALFVNSHPVVTLEATELGIDPTDVAERLAVALDAPLRTDAVNTPPEEEWTWADVYASIPDRQT